MTTEAETRRWLIVGLGNPGPEYAGNRHNAGFMVLDELAARVGGRFKSHRSRAEVVEGRLAGHPVVLAKPRSYMNLSGGPVKALADFYKVPPADLIVVHDELDLDPGRLRVKFGGGDNGHNGLRSIRRSLGTGDFYRVRIGVGRPPGRQDPADFLLSNIPASQQADFAVEVERAADAVESLIIAGLERTQSFYNG